MTHPGSHGSSAGATLVDDWPEAKPLLDAHIAREPDVLKLTYEERGWGSRPTIPRLPVELMQTIVENYARLVEQPEYPDQPIYRDTIEPGKYADMVLLDANPAEDINNVKAIVEVIKGGRIIDRSALSLPVNR